jgi:hypothetical protein
VVAAFLNLECCVGKLASGGQQRRTELQAATQMTTAEFGRQSPCTQARPKLCKPATNQCLRSVEPSNCFDSAASNVLKPLPLRFRVNTDKSVKI